MSIALPVGAPLRLTLLGVAFVLVGLIGYQIGRPSRDQRADIIIGHTLRDACAQAEPGLNVGIAGWQEKGFQYFLAFNCQREPVQNQ